MTLLIKNVRIVGGDPSINSGQANTEPQDVFIIRDTISAIGNFRDKKADQILDGGGGYLSPGFIDIHATPDHYLKLFDHPEQDYFLKQGVTSIIGGHCGSSLAPLLYGSLESIRKWADPDRVNVNWHTVKEFLITLQQRKLGVHFGTLIGHSTIRRAIIGEELRDLTDNELTLFKAILVRALEEGGFGLSLGLGYVHARNTPYAEIRVLAEVVREHGRLIGVHTRKSGMHLESELTELVTLRKEIDTTIFINHLLPFIGQESSYEKALRIIDGAASGMYFGLHPFLTSTFPIYKLLPDWAQNGGLEVMLLHVTDQALRSRLMNDMTVVDPEKCFVVEASRNESLIGKSLKELMGLFGLSDVSLTILRLLETTKLRALISYENVSLEMHTIALRHTKSFVTSGAHGIDPNHKEGVFPAFLNLREKLGLSLEQAVQKITRLPAELLGMQRRRVLKEGNIADLTLFTAQPEIQIKATIVAGEIAMHDGLIVNGRNGSILKPPIT